MSGSDGKVVESALDPTMSPMDNDPFDFDALGESSQFGGSRFQAPLKNNLYVGSLPPDFTTDALVALFTPYGPIIRCKVGTNRTGKNAGYGFVQFESEESANKAIQALNGVQVQDKKLHVSVALGRSKRGPRPKTNLYFSGLPLSFTTKDLTKMCEGFGRIIGSRVLVNPVTNLSRGYGFVRFDTHENALRAISVLNGTISPSGVEPLIVKFARDPTDPEHPSQRRLQKALPSPPIPPGVDVDAMTGAFARPGAVWMMSVPGAMEQQQSLPTSPELQHRSSERGGGARRGAHPPRFSPLRGSKRAPRGPHLSPPQTIVPIYSSGLIPRPMATHIPLTHTSFVSSLTSRFSTMSIDPNSNVTIKVQDPSQGVPSVTGPTPPNSTDSTVSKDTKTTTPEGSEQPQNTAIFVSGLAPTIDKSELLAMFEGAGKVMAFRIFPPQNGVCSALVCYDQATSAQHAIETLNKTKPSGAAEPLTIKIAPNSTETPTPSVVSTKLPDPVDPGQFVYQQPYYIPYYTYNPSYPYAYAYSGSSPYTILSSAPSTETSGDSSSLSSPRPTYRPYVPDVSTMYTGPSTTAYYQPMTTPMYTSFSSSPTISTGEGYYSVTSSTVHHATSSTSTSGFHGTRTSQEYYYTPEGRLFVRPTR